jgi:hypothetical protein
MVVLIRSLNERWYLKLIYTLFSSTSGNWSTRRKSSTCRKSLTTLSHNVILLYRVHLACAGFEFTTLVVIDTDCIGGYKTKYHMITTTTAAGRCGLSKCIYICILKFYFIDEITEIILTIVIYLFLMIYFIFGFFALDLYTFVFCALS